MVVDTGLPQRIILSVGTIQMGNGLVMENGKSPRVAAFSHDFGRLHHPPR